MDLIKIENFQKDNPTGRFPSYRSFDDEEGEIIRSRLIKRLNLPSNVDLVDYIANSATILEGVDAESTNFNLMDLIQSLRLKSSNEVFINWYHFDDIDQINFKDLSDCFDYVWYPSLDDIDIFDDTLTWFISISHHSTVSVYFCTDAPNE